ncbi:NUDIX domain-containing protein [Halorubellus sp. JP-L1]|uniref:NUDIX domain-containing protein n=1 Tax=Halorubellus sp. JP-L1 TaxID=2715753 RepID=UPI00140E65DF|nr:NUDIX domain-containing protein [Halorubellus sp. JP-L1]NHN43488.1 NUDIX domain-containing protein [Halorubellus sp. JP-L1]
MTRNDDTTDGRTDAKSTGSSPTASEIGSLADPDDLRERETVACSERDRVLPAEKFDALRERYERIDGVVQVGVTNDDGAVLLVGEPPYAPPGGNVEAGEDWVAAAERAMTTITGVDVRVDDAVAFERTAFRSGGDADASFHADSVLFEASLVDPPAGYREDPTFADDLDHPLYGDGSEHALAWVDAVTDDVHENHRGDVDAFLD